MSFNPRETQEDRIIHLMAIALIILLCAGVVFSFSRDAALDYRAISAAPVQGSADITCTQPGVWNSGYTTKLEWPGGSQTIVSAENSRQSRLCLTPERLSGVVVFPASDPERWYFTQDHDDNKLTYQIWLGACAMAALALIGFGWGIRAYLREKQFQKTY